MVTAALLAALLAASAWISVPVGAVPVTLQVFVVLLAGLLLTPRGALAAVGVYLLLGAAGLPVFAGGLGGAGVLAGPTGGYLWGFALGATAVAWLGERGARRMPATAARILALTAGVSLIYLAGWLQLSAVTGMGPWPAFAAGVAPFLLMDVAKAAVALGVARALARAGFAR
ncbi:MAG: biotin transporter BioY [Coriobacteriia bacterium]|nr:biotin transporter BioY [Coriobacteriia bacterium]